MMKTDCKYQPTAKTWSGLFRQLSCSRMVEHPPLSSLVTVLCSITRSCVMHNNISVTDLFYMVPGFTISISYDLFSYCFYWLLDIENRRVNSCSKKTTTCSQVVVGTLNIPVMDSNSLFHKPNENRTFGLLSCSHFILYFLYIFTLVKIM